MFKTTGVNQHCQGETLLKSISAICKPFSDGAGEAEYDLVIQPVLGKAFADVQSNNYISTYSLTRQQQLFSCLRGFNLILLSCSDNFGCS